MEGRRFFRMSSLVLSLCFLWLLSGCGGGGSSSTAVTTPPGSSNPTQTPTDTQTTAGIALPQEVSAISADNDATAAQTSGLRARLMAVADAASQLPADSDYQTEVAAKYVDEPALQVFDIIDTILKAVSQTHYADPANVNAGPYKTMVSWYETDNGQKMKQVQTWIVDSKMDNGTNIVDIWPEGDHMPSAVETKIEKAPTQATDGSYTDYGKWTITAKFNASGSAYFEASADIDANGMTVLTINEVDEESSPNGPLTATTKAIVHKTSGSGYGQALVPNWDACYQQGSTACSGGQVPGVQVKYAYNQDYLTYQKLDSNGNPVDAQIFKDRNNKVEMDYQYGLFDAATGADVQKTKSFGFPVNYTDANGTHQAYYGAWQGLHQLWSNDGSAVPDGTTVTRADVGGNQTAASYTVKSFPGSLTKRTLVASDIAQLLNIPVQAWINQNLTLIYDGTNHVWKECVNPTWSNGPMTCSSETDFSSQMTTLKADRSGQKAVNIDGWDQTTNQPIMYAYNGSGFDIVDQNGNVTGSYTPADGDVLTVSIGGNIYLEYTGNFDSTTNNSGWVQKTLTAFDQNTNTPTFGATDQPFDFANGAQYSLNNNGANFVVERTATNGAAADYQTSMEIQTVANPANVATVVPTGTVFKQQWDTSVDATTYTFDSNPTSAGYLMLVYQHVSQQDQQAGHGAGDVLTDGAWGLLAYDQNGNQLTDANGPLQYNWQYAASGDDWGAATYLVDGSGNYKLLDDPVMLKPLQLTTNGGDTLNFSLQYDGWLHGLPDMHQELEKNNYQITKTIADKVVNIPAGTPVSDEAGNDYFIKPMEIGVILPVITASDITAAGKTAPDLTAANQADLSTIPAFVDPNVAAAPTDTTLKYIEGKPVQ